MRSGARPSAIQASDRVARRKFRAGEAPRWTLRRGRKEVMTGWCTAPCVGVLTRAPTTACGARPVNHRLLWSRSYYRASSVFFRAKQRPGVFRSWRVSYARPARTKTAQQDLHAPGKQFVRSRFTPMHPRETRHAPRRTPGARHSPSHKTQASRIHGQAMRSPRSPNRR